ncbi:MAG: exonuclease SbcCD subunit D C-terminal domain-containing protein [Sandaracinaceae bacterium]
MPRTFTLCHTSDWHLGHTLHGYSRELEHAAFLEHLLRVLKGEEADALIIAGDVFETSNPPASAQAMFYRFLADARIRLPDLDILVIAGNHDSAARLSAAQPLLDAIGVRLVGVVPRRDGTGRAPVDAEAMRVPFHDQNGEVAAQVAAVPFLRPSDLPFVDPAPGVDPLIEGVRRVYDDVLTAARAAQRVGQALIATGHCHMFDAARSERSERPILGGAQHALPVDVFAADVDYVALGHLHLAQTVGGRDHVRYSGSPIPLSMPEESYPHQVRIARFEDGALTKQHAVPVPRTVDVLRVPRERPGELDEVLDALARLDVPNGVPEERRPFLEVRVRLAEPIADLRARIEDALGDRAVRLVKITTEYAATPTALADTEPRRSLSDVSIDDVFLRAYARRYEGEPSPELWRAFHEVAAAAQRQLEESSG